MDSLVGHDIKYTMSMHEYLPLTVQMISWLCILPHNIKSVSD